MDSQALMNNISLLSKRKEPESQENPTYVIKYKANHQHFISIKTYSSSVVAKLKVSAGTTLAVLVDLAEGLGLAKMVSLQLVFKGLVGGLREHAFFFKNRQDTHGL